MKSESKIVSDIQTELNLVPESQGELSFLLPDIVVCGTDSVSQDADGDLVLKRSLSHTTSELKLQLQGHTSLETVGLQVWAGALLMADYILAEPSTFRGCIGLELGAGTGLAGLCLARVAKLTFLTDADTAVLQQLQANASLNRHLYDNAESLRVRRLDWSCGLPAQERQNLAASDASPQQHRNGDLLSWTEEDISELKQVQVLLAADVIYDVDLTEAFLECSCCLLSQAASSCCLYLSIDKRFNFAVGDKEPMAHLYDHFMGTIEQRRRLGQASLHGRRLNLEAISQAFPIGRSKHLELWRFQLDHSGSHIAP
ncbi:hypothetical protein WJX74_009735 [Apatococcus lobatus]|uniref:Methyltransferase-like protein 22 n=1 Tax=Apatococcus lobatus TaxID=904363 RepID=A0AAW1RZC1_9CHLO